MRKSEVGKNLLYQSLYEILIIILPLFTSPYIARVLGAEQLGVFSYTYSIAYYFQIFGMLGIKFYGNKVIAQVRDNKEKLNQTYSELLILHICSAVISLLLFVTYIIFWGKDYKLFFAMQSLMVMAAVFDVSWLFFGLEKFKITVSQSSVIKILSVIAIFIFVKEKSDLWKYIIIMAGSQLLNQLLIFSFAKKYVRFQYIKINALRVHIKPLFSLFLPVIAVSLFKYMDKIMLGTMGSKVELGYYENADKILNMPLSVISAFGSVMLPRVANLVSKENAKGLAYYMKNSFKYMGVMSIAMAFGMAGIASVFSPVFWGVEFNKSAVIIEMLAITLPFTTISTIVRNQDLIPSGNDKYYTYAVGMGALINLLINALLIPRLESIGVAVGTILAEVIVFFVQFIFVRGNYAYKEYMKTLMFYFVPGILMFGVVKLIGNILGIHVYTLLVQVLCGGAVFITISIVYLLIVKDETMIILSDRFKKIRK